jgi:hypothetical protein
MNKNKKTEDLDFMNEVIFKDCDFRYLDDNDELS